MTLLAEPLVTPLIIYPPFLVRLNINLQQSYPKYCDITDIGLKYQGFIVSFLNVMLCGLLMCPYSVYKIVEGFEGRDSFSEVQRTAVVGIQ